MIRRAIRNPKGLFPVSVTRKNCIAAVSHAKYPTQLSLSSYQVSKRYLSTTSESSTVGKEKSTDGDQSSKAMKEFDYDNYEDFEPRTAGEQVAVYTRLFAMMALLGVAGVGIYYTGQVLFPGRMSPFSLFSTAFDTVKVNDEIRMICGEPMRAYGKESSNEGRRTNLDYRQFAEDDSERTRIRFNVKGPKGQVMVWAEISNNMAHNEYVFLICQDRRTRRVITIEDNRDRLEVEKLAANSQPKSTISAMWDTIKSYSPM